MTFSSLKLDSKLLATLEKLGYTKPTPIQEQAIPKAIEGYDILASADTGTGKTAAFLLPVLHRLATSERRKGPQVLILVPTRELAMQVTDQAVKYSSRLGGVKVVTIFGGVPYPLQRRQLSKPYEILIATPGRLMDHMEAGRIDLSVVETLILDEADRMLDMGFIEPVKEITSHASPDRQTVMFSATIDKRMESLSRELLIEPVRITIERNRAEHDHIEQRLHIIDDLYHKYKILDRVLADPTLGCAVIFSSTKRFADSLVDRLVEQGFSAAALHGDMNQRQRTRTIGRMRDGKIRILVATDVAARGIDIPSITHVINFDLPMGVEDYVHRIGRTGRAGATGCAISFAGQRDIGLLKRIEEYIGKQIPQHVIEGLEPRARSQSPRKPFKKPYGRSFGGKPKPRRAFVRR